MEMIIGCDISGMNAVSCLIDLIEDTHVKTGAIAGRYAEPEALYSEYLSTLTSTSATSDHTTRNFLKSGRKQSRDRMNPHVRNSTANEAKPNKSHVKFYNWGGQGHYVGQCSKPKKKCDKCKKYGHLPTECKAIKAVGTLRANLKVDKAEAPVDILVVPTEVQTVPLLVEQSFLNIDGITLQVHKQKLGIDRYLEESLTQIDAEKPTSIVLTSKSDVVIDKHQVCYVEVECNDHLGDIYVEDAMRLPPGKEHYIERCVISSRNPIVQVVNISDGTVSYRRTDVVARGLPCTLDVERGTGQIVEVRQLDLFKSFVEEDLTNLIEPDMSQEHRHKLLTLLNEYQQCFASNIAELGRCGIEKMSITLTDEKPVTYRPCRLACSERTQVRKMVSEILKYGIIKESNSPYASPKLLDKKKRGDLRLCVMCCLSESGNLRFTKVMAYLDDILIPSEDVEQGFAVLKDVLQ
nr:unnamed protein product [Callosobruchus chinensis]